MSLLDALPLLGLLLAQPIKLLLVLLLQRRIDGSGIWRFQRRRTVWVGASLVRQGISPPVIFLRVLGGAVRTARSARFHRGMAVEFARPHTGSNVWPAAVHGSQQSAICAGGLLMLGLVGGHGA